jgi:hypothetical protein
LVTGNKTMVRIAKCSACRCAKQKVTAMAASASQNWDFKLTVRQCLPEERPWNADVQQKCVNCLRGGRPCGPNENPPDRPPRKRVCRAQETQNSGSIAQLEELRQVEENIETFLGSNRTPAKVVSDNSKELRDRSDPLLTLRRLCEIHANEVID